VLACLFYFFVFACLLARWLDACMLASLFARLFSSLALL